MPLHRALERSLFSMGNRLAQARADIEDWLSEPPPSCRPLDLSELEDRVMLSASPAVEASLAEAPSATVDDILPNGDPAMAAESESVLLSAVAPDAATSTDADNTNQPDLAGDESRGLPSCRNSVLGPRSMG